MATRKCQIVLLLGALLLVACATVEAPDQPEAITLGMGTTDGSCGTTLCCSNCPAIPVLRVIDGDTFVTTRDQRVRLFGVDTPERGEECYREATARLREPAGGEVWVVRPQFIDFRMRFLLGESSQYNSCSHYLSFRAYGCACCYQTSMEYWFAPWPLRA